MATAIQSREETKQEIMEQVVIQGDLAELKPAERVNYFFQLCKALNLNALSKPFEYLKLNGKITLYATKECAAQLRTTRKVSLGSAHVDYQEGLVVVTIDATLPDGRTDSDIGAVGIENLRGENRANAIMKAITKAKRRVTLSICGLGFLDESEIDSIAGAERVKVDMSTGEILPPKPLVPPRRQQAEPEPQVVDAEMVNESAPSGALSTPAQIASIKGYATKPPWGAQRKAEFKSFCNDAAGKPFANPAELTFDQALLVIDGLKACETRAALDAEAEKPDPFLNE